MTTKDQIIASVYKKYLGSRSQTLDRIKSDDKKKSEADPSYVKSGITKQDVDKWFLTNDQLAPATKAPYKTKFNSFVAPGPKHTFQVDLFNFRYEQEINFKKNPPPPHGLVCVDVFTKQVHVVPLQDKTAVSWRDGLEQLIAKMGRPQIIMTDPDASITSVEIDEWFRRNKDIKHIMTRRHASFAERELREFKQIMYRKIKNEVKPWPQYLDEVLLRMNTGRHSKDDDEDDKVYPHATIGLPPDEAVKPENWFEVHNNIEIHAKYRRKYPELKVGDKVKVYRQRGVLTKEVVGDYKYDASVITNIFRSLGQTFYKVEGEGKPLLRSDILLFKENEDTARGAEAQEGQVSVFTQRVADQRDQREEEPYMSYRRKRIIARENNKELRESRAKLASEAKEAVKKAKSDAKESLLKGRKTKGAIASAKAKVKDESEWDDLARAIAERARLRKQAQGSL